MIMFWNRKLIYTGYSMKEFNEKRNILDKNEINYVYKVSNRNNGALFDTSRAKVGTLGEKFELSYEYRIYVHKEDYENAIYIIR